MPRFRLYGILPILWLFAILPAARSDIAYEEQVRFTSPEGTFTNRFALTVGKTGVRVEEEGPRTLVFSADAGELRLLDRETGRVSDLSELAAGARFVQLRESMERLARVLRHLPEETAAPLRAEAIELRRALRDTMRGVLPWSPGLGRVADFDQWEEEEKTQERFGFQLRHFVRESETEAGRREILLLDEEALPLDPGLLDLLDAMENAWMSVLAGEEDPMLAPGERETSPGFVVEERDVRDGRLLWEVRRTIPREVEADPNRYRLPGHP